MNDVEDRIMKILDQIEQDPGLTRRNEVLFGVVDRLIKIFETTAMTFDVTPVGSVTPR